MTAVLVLLAFADRLVWRPAIDPPQRTDAVVVLGGPDIDARVTLGRRLARRYHVPLEISVDDVKQCRFGRYQTPLSSCFRPEPFTTQGEARWTANAARLWGWSSVTVVVSVDQVDRARLRMTRCSVPGLRMAAAVTSVRERLARTPYQLAAYLKAETLQRSC